jgi:hypothetical protein
VFTGELLALFVVFLDLTTIALVYHTKRLVSSYSLDRSSYLQVSARYSVVGISMPFCVSTKILLSPL